MVRSLTSRSSAKDRAVTTRRRRRRWMISKRRSARRIPATASAVAQRADPLLELRQPCVERRLRVDDDLELARVLAAVEDTDGAGVCGLERDHHSFARDAEPVEHFEDPLDLA